SYPPVRRGPDRPVHPPRTGRPRPPRGGGRPAATVLPRARPGRPWRSARRDLSSRWRERPRALEPTVTCLRVLSPGRRSLRSGRFRSLPPADRRPAWPVPARARFSGFQAASTLAASAQVVDLRQLRRRLLERRVVSQPEQLPHELEAGVAAGLAEAAQADRGLVQ